LRDFFVVLNVGLLKKKYSGRIEALMKTHTNNIKS
jgi:hypothetical protein